MGHMMNFQVGLAPEHLIDDSNTGLCARRCAGVTIGGSTSCEYADCNVLPDEDVLFNDVNSTLFTYLMNQCSGYNNPDPRSPCDPPTSSDACTETGYPLASAMEACASLQAKPTAYDSCIYDCCVTADADFCRGLAEESDEEAKDFEQELIEDGRFVNVEEKKPFYQLNKTLPAASDSRWVCSMEYRVRSDTLEATVLPNGVGEPATLEEVQANIYNVLMLLDASATNRTQELLDALEAAHLDDGQLYACTEFHMAPSEIGDDGASVLAASFQRGAMPRLEQLTLSSNSIGTNGTTALASAFRLGGAHGAILRNLKILNLHTNVIDAYGVIELASALESGALGSLQYVDLASNPVSDIVKQQLANARPGLVVR